MSLLSRCITEGSETTTLIEHHDAQYSVHHNVILLST